MMVPSRYDVGAIIVSVGKGFTRASDKRYGNTLTFFNY